MMVALTLLYCKWTFILVKFTLHFVFDKMVCINYVLQLNHHYLAKEVKHRFGDRNINFVLISSWQNLQNFMLANKSLVNRRYFSLFFFSRVKSWSPIVWNTSELWSGWVPYRNWLKMLRYQNMEILWILSLISWVSFSLLAIIFIPQIFIYSWYLLSS